MKTTSIRIKEFFSFGWQTFKSCPWLFIAAPLVLFAVMVGIGMVEHLASWIFGVREMKLLIDIESVVVSFLMSIGVTSFYLKAHDTVATTELKDLWNPKPFWRFAGVAILGGGAVLIGLILLIVPGVIIALAFSFAGILVIEKGMGPIEALKESVRLTKGHRFALFKLSLASVGLNIIGLLALVVGIFVTGPITQLAFIKAYRTLSKEGQI